jgi:hypothetical protein
MPMPDDCTPGVLEAVLQAEAEFQRLLLDAAPMPEGSSKDFRYMELKDLHERYMPSAELMAIARLLYMLDAYGVTDGETLDRLIALHNARMTELADDAAYLHRMRVPRKRLLDAMFSGPAKRNAVRDFQEHGRIALNATNMGRLLVEFANKAQVTEAMELLTSLGLLEKAKDKGDYNSEVRVSTGRLEAIYRAYLTHLAHGVSAAVAATQPGHDLRQPKANGKDARI